MFPPRSAPSLPHLGGATPRLLGSQPRRSLEPHRAALELWQWVQLKSLRFDHLSYQNLSASWEAHPMVIPPSQGLENETKGDDSSTRKGGIGSTQFRTYTSFQYYHEVLPNNARVSTWIDFTGSDWDSQIWVEWRLVSQVRPWRMWYQWRVRVNNEVLFWKQAL